MDMNVAETDYELVKKLDTNVYLSPNDKQSLKSSIEQLEARLQAWTT